MKYSWHISGSGSAAIPSPIAWVISKSSKSEATEGFEGLVSFRVSLRV